MLLYILIKFTLIEEICLKYFETNHGQNEWDSAHSAISHAILHAGDILNDVTNDKEETSQDNFL